METNKNGLFLMHLSNRIRIREDKKEWERFKTENPLAYKLRQKAYFGELFSQARDCLMMLLQEDKTMSQWLHSELCKITDSDNKHLKPVVIFPTKDSKPGNFVIALVFHTDNPNIGIRETKPENLSLSLTIATGTNNSSFQHELAIEDKDILDELKLMANDEYMVNVLLDAFGEPKV